MSEVGSRANHRSRPAPGPRNPRGERSRVARKSLAERRAVPTRKEARTSDSHDDSLNVLHSRHTVVDQRIDSLLKTLTETLPTYSTSRGGQALSGGRTTTRTKRGTRPKRSDCDIDEIRAAVMDTIAAAEYLGCDMWGAKRQMALPDKQRDRRQLERCMSVASSSVSAALPGAIKAVSESIHHLEKLGLDMSHEKPLLGSSVKSMRGRDYRMAVSSLAECKKRLREDELRPSIKAILKARRSVIAARKTGCDVGTATTLLNQSMLRLKARDASEAMKLAGQALAAAQEPLELRRNARELVRASTRTVAVARGLGMDVREAADLLSQSQKLLSTGNFALAAGCAKKAIALATVHTSTQISGLIELAEMNIKLSKDSDIPTANAERDLHKAKESLSRNEFAGSLESACASLLESNSAIAGGLQKRVKEFDRFAREMTAEIDSFKQVQEAIEHSKQRSLETVRKYAGLSEEVVNLAYENASAYARVSQDIMGQACESAVGLTGNGTPTADGTPAVEPHPSVLGKVMSISKGDRKLRIIDSFLSGKITAAELDRLLDLVDSDASGLEIVSL